MLPSLPLRFCPRNKSPYLLQILGVTSVIFASLGFGFDASRPHNCYGIENVVGSQSASDESAAPDTDEDSVGGA
jgi:hypothetical protein